MFTAPMRGHVEVAKDHQAIAIVLGIGVAINIESGGLSRDQFFNLANQLIQLLFPNTVVHSASFEVQIERGYWSVFRRPEARSCGPTGNRMAFGHVLVCKTDGGLVV